MEPKTTYLNNINYFRGIAIVFIVFGHCFGLGISTFYDNTSFLGKVIRSVIPGGTTFFVFISGFLLHHIHNKKFHFRTFFFKKVKYVLIPFLLISSTDIIYYLTRFIFAYVTNSKFTEFYLTKINSYSFFKTYLLGHNEINQTLWYIPFIMIIFSFSKFYMQFVKINYKNQFWIMCLLMLLSTIIHRTQGDYIYSIFQNVLYFTPVYLLGIFTSTNIKTIYEKLIGKELYLVFLALAITIFQTKIGKLENMLTSNTINIKNFDLMIIQKSLLAIFFILFLMRFEHKKMKFMTLLAENSFGIFFIHGIYIWLANAIVFKLEITFTSTSIIIFMVSAGLILMLSLFTTILLRKLLPNKSKYIIGC